MIDGIGVPLIAMPDRARRTALLVGALACLANIGQTSFAASRSPLAAERPWCLAARPPATVAGYLAIHNTGHVSDRLTAITSPDARRVSIHQSSVVGGVASMKTLNSVEIPARATIVFAPGGLHLMFDKLRRPLDVGDRVSVTLWFKDAGPVHTHLVVLLRPPLVLSTSPMKM
jgi:copper(I)-binding protein